MKVHSIHVDGRQGAHGTNGQTRNSWHGRAGEHGEDAGRPSAGCGGGSVVLHLSSSTSVEGKIELVETRCTGSGGEEWAQTLQLLLDVDTTIDVRAKGGCGGRGGVGGNGGNGKRGSNGSVSFNDTLVTVPQCLCLEIHSLIHSFLERFTILFGWTWGCRRQWWRCGPR